MWAVRPLWCSAANIFIGHWKAGHKGPLENISAKVKFKWMTVYGRYSGIFPAEF